MDYIFPMTAYSPEFKTRVKVLWIHLDVDGRPLFNCILNDEDGDTAMLFREFELTDFQNENSPYVFL